MKYRSLSRVSLRTCTSDDTSAWCDHLDACYGNFGLHDLAVRPLRLNSLFMITSSRVGQRCFEVHSALDDSCRPTKLVLCWLQLESESKSPWKLASSRTLEQLEVQRDAHSRRSNLALVCDSNLTITVKSERARSSHRYQHRNLLNRCGI